MKSIPRVLTIAGSDSGGGAGIQADLKTFCAFNVYGMSVITAVTAQNTSRVHGVMGIDADFIGLQFEAVLTDIGVDALKTGMLFNVEIVQTVAAKLYENPMIPSVVDPVMISTGGDALLEKNAVDAIRSDLLPAASLVTPNLAEARLLAGFDIHTIADMKKGAEIIARSGCGAVLIKGGHLKESATDILFDGDSFHTFDAPRINTMNTHGTGCTYSAAIAANLAKGLSLVQAVSVSKQYITKAIEKAFPLGKGHGPLNHMIYFD